ncbi:PIN domain-containing protein [Hymenobacter sp. H14-R3]|uniref:type II toxin-antitoxin system VapC family toxin n=1 Tax=Hymenobacter sp. H14-R3 TaxID=3046308 RepID=UPI0024B9EA35|nr:PIN domain-containing protein [Hymenobacter sp. H14-R3]MDJ0366405.1 PIN domain-containing protein [Hymenobacter sp. H14-R3]
MSRFFVDTNVLLDFIMRRPPFAISAAELFQLAEDRKLVLYCSSLSFSQAHYILRKVVGSAKAQDLLLDTADLVTIVAVDSRSVHDALRSSFSDFEDALQYFAATSQVSPAIEAIVTRDPKGFAAGALPFLTPPEALARLGS